MRGSVWMGCELCMSGLLFTRPQREQNRGLLEYCLYCPLHTELYCHGKAKSRGVETKERQHPKCHPAHYFWPETRGPGQKQCTIQRIGYHLGHRQLLNTKPCDGFRNNGPGGCVERAKKSWAFKALWICLQSLFQFLWHSAFLSMAMLSSINIAHYWYELSFPV